MGVEQEPRTAQRTGRSSITPSKGNDTFFAIVCVIDAWLVTRGLFFIHGSFKAPDLFVSALGTHRFGAANLSVIAFPKRIFFRDRREILMPHLVNSLKIYDFGTLNRRHIML